MKTASLKVTMYNDVFTLVCCRLIFRMFDRDEDGMLSPEELANVVHQIEEAKAAGNLMENSRRDAAIVEARKVFDLKDSEKLSLVNFLTAVGNLKFRGTSLLFRAPHSILDHLDTSL